MYTADLFVFKRRSGNNRNKPLGVDGIVHFNCHGICFRIAGKHLLTLEGIPFSIASFVETCW